MCQAGVYYALGTDGRRIFLRRSCDLSDLYRQPATIVWTAPRHGPASKHLWAPELHWLDDHWFIYYAANDGRSRNHRLWALAASDATGPYQSCGMLQTGGWAIDATVSRAPGGQLCLFWSGREDIEQRTQSLYVAPLHDPFTVGGPRVLLARPTQDWEQRGAPICEGPAVLRRGALSCLIYSASASWTVHSCLGMLVNRTGEYLTPGSWQKSGPVFARTADVWGVGHCSLLGWDTGGAIFYHTKTKRSRGWRDRNIRAQTFRWDGAGLPSFGQPAPV